MVYVIIVTYNGENFIRKCLSSLINSSAEVKIIVVDNNSTDSTLQIIRSEFPEISLIESKTNNGFAAANNIGIKLALQNNPEYFFLLNQDAWVEKNTIQELITISSNNSSYGIISPVHLNGSYTDLDIKFANYLAPQECAGFLSDLYLNKLKDIYEAVFVNAAAWLITSDCIKRTGIFDPLFFFYGEDSNYLQRAKFHGLKIGITTRCTICHDREVRQGQLNSIEIKKLARSQSLVMLLNIQESFKKCSYTFFYQKLYKIINLFSEKKFSQLKYQFRELFFFFTNIGKLKRIRKNYSQPTSISID